MSNTHRRAMLRHCAWFLALKPRLVRSCCQRGVVKRRRGISACAASCPPTAPSARPWKPRSMRVLLHEPAPRGETECFQPFSLGNDQIAREFLLCECLEFRIDGPDSRATNAAISYATLADHAPRALHETGGESRGTFFQTTATR